MAKYSDSIITMLKKDEGYVGQNPESLKRAHNKTSSDHGAYYDAKGYLTTGYGSLISKNKRGSEEESADIESWMSNHNYDPFTLTEEQATEILPRDIDRVTARAKEQLGNVDFDTLPEQAQQAVVSLAYNAGQIGRNTAAAIQKASESKSTSDWQKVASMFANWHGNKASDQPSGVLARRKREASLVGSIEGLFPEGSDSITRNNYVEDFNIPDGQVEPSSDRSPDGTPVEPTSSEQTVPYVDPQGRISKKPISSHTVPNVGNDGAYQNPDQVLEGSAFAGPSAFENKQKEYVLQETEADKPFVQSVEEFGDHLYNSFLTENVVGSTVKKVATNWNVNQSYVPGFDATKMLDFPELINGIPPENLKTLLDESPNPTVFRNKAIAYNIETKAREDIGKYMAANPVKGFVGIGIASVVDVTSLIPVGKIANFVGLTKAAKSIPMLARTIGAGIGENLVQDLLQESFLTANSDIRKWDDGDILYGAAGGAILGGAAGAFKYSKGLSKYEKLASKYIGEKNLSSMEVMIRNAEKKGYSTKVINELNQTKKFIEQSLQADHRAMILKEIGNVQERIGQGILDSKKIEIIKEQLVYNKAIEDSIAVERAKPNPVAAAIKDSKGEAKAIKAEAMIPVNKLRDENTTLSKQINSLKKQAAEAGPESKAQKKIDSLVTKRELNNKRIEELNNEIYKQAKKSKGDKNRAIRTAQKAVDPREAKIAELEDMKRATKEMLQEEYDDLASSIKDGSHPELQLIGKLDSVNEIAQSLGLTHLNFKSIDDLDEFLGLKFDDSTHKSAGAAAVKNLGFLKGGDVDTYFNKFEGDVWQVISNNVRDARENPGIGFSSHQINKTGTYAQILRATRINEFMTTDSVVGRWILNKSAIRSGDNEFAQAFYNLFAPDGMGRAGQGKLSVIEKQQQLSNIFGGGLREKMMPLIDDINKEALGNPELRKAFGLSENKLAAQLQMAEVGHVEKVSELLRDELIESGMMRNLYGDRIGDLVEKMKSDFNKVNADILARAKEAGVQGVDEIEQGANTKDWFHRSWDNKAVRKFYAREGEQKLVELVNSAMFKHLAEAGVKVSNDMAKDISAQAKKFAFGLHNSDLEVNKAANLSTMDFLQSLIDKNLDGVDAGALKSEMLNVAQRAEANAKKELGKRKPLNLNAVVLTNDGQEFAIKDLLEKNIFVSQKSYIEGMAARIAAAENGIKNLDDLDKWADIAHEIEMKRGKIDSAEYIHRAMKEDIKAFKHGSAGVSGEIDNGSSRVLRMAKKYQFARLMQYTGISSIAELATLIPEAGYKAVSASLTGELSKVFKTALFGGITGKEFTNDLYKGLSSITGVGIEDLGYDALISSSNMITTSKIGNVFERGIDNAAKATRRATGHVEVIGRRLAVNSLALNFGDIAFGNSKLDNLLGGLSNRNLVELGLADLDEVTGKAIVNDKWKSIMESIKAHALDENKQLVSSTGKPIKDFNIEKWDVTTRRTFGDALTQQANHIMVNPDSTTAALWHSTPVGSIFNTFRTFSNNASSKIAGHNVNQAIQGYKMGSMAEFSKTAQKYFWGAALGKLSLMLYGAIDNAGRPDFSQRMEKYIHMDDPRDWTQALGRSSAITGLDEVLDSSLGLFGQEPLFASSTIGQSRNRFDLMRTPTGSLLADATKTVEYTAQGKFDKAGKKLIKMSPLRRQLGVNQLLNSMGIE